MRTIHLTDLRDYDLISLVGPSDQNLNIISEYFNTELSFRNQSLYVKDVSDPVFEKISDVVAALCTVIKSGRNITPQDVIYACRQISGGREVSFEDYHSVTVGRTLSGKVITPRTKGQYDFVTAMDRSPIVFAIGPAGTGKTYLAVIKAVTALKNGDVKRIVLTRPAVEAGENLGFLPGDLKEKVDPYLTPLYDALNVMLGREQTEKLIERGIVEIAPLAYMRGRTLEDSFVILDEAQNTTAVQMKMFLTRLGFHSRMIVTGDTTQIDLKPNIESGLIQAAKILEGIREIEIIQLTGDDVVRHPLVQKIIERYESFGRK